MGESIEDSLKRTEIPNFKRTDRRKGNSHTCPASVLQLQQWLQYLANCMSIGSSDSIVHQFLCCRANSSTAHYLICFRQNLCYRISSPAMPTQTWPLRPGGRHLRGRPLRRRGQQQRHRRACGTWPRRAPRAGTADAKKTYTLATQLALAARVPAAATGASGEDSGAVLYACCKAAN